MIDNVRAELWVRFAAASVSREWRGPGAPSLEDIAIRAEREAERMLRSFDERWSPAPPERRSA